MEDSIGRFEDSIFLSDCCWIWNSRRTYFIVAQVIVHSHNYTRKNVTDLLQPVKLQAWHRYDIIAISDWCRLQTVQNWRYQTGTVCWVVRAVSLWCNRMIQVCWEQTVAVCKNRLTGMLNQQHWWKLLVSDKSGLMNTDDKASVLIPTVTIIAVTGLPTVSWTDLISVLLNAATDHAFFHV